MPDLIMHKRLCQGSVKNRIKQLELKIRLLEFRLRKKDEKIQCLEADIKGLCEYDKN